MLQNAYFLLKIDADTAENERNLAENLPKIGNPTVLPMTGASTLGDPAEADEEELVLAPAGPGGGDGPLPPDEALSNS